MKLVRPALLVAASSLVLSACTLVPTDSNPRTVNSSEVPSGLLNGAGIKQTIAVNLYFYDVSGTLTKVSGRIAAPLSVATLIERLSTPLSGDLTTLVNKKLDLERAIIRGSEAVVVVRSGLSVLGADSTMRALTQMASTLRDSFGVTTLTVTDLSTNQTLTVDVPAA